MREFNVYIEADKHGLINDAQRRQLLLIINCLKGRCVNLLWQIAGDRLTQRQIFNILRYEHLLFKRKGTIIHNEFQAERKVVSFMARWFVKKLSIELYEDKRLQEKDYICLYYGNEPEGCSFSSCLGNNVYIQKEGNLSICPHGTNIRLNPLMDEGSLTDMYETDAFKVLLSKHIQKRGTCKATCQMFDLCHGGCPLQNDSWESCEIMRNATEQGSKATEDDLLEQRASCLAAMYRG